MIPRAFPPFLLKWAMRAVESGWKLIEGRIFIAFLTLIVSSTKIEKISDMMVGLERVQYVWLRTWSAMNGGVPPYNTYRLPPWLDLLNSSDKPLSSITPRFLAITSVVLVELCKMGGSSTSFPY